MRVEEVTELYVEVRELDYQLVDYFSASLYCERSAWARDQGLQIERLFSNRIFDVAP